VTRRKDDTWVVKLDEFHPDHRVAATHADIAAQQSARTYHRGQMLRLLELDAEQTLVGADRANLSYHTDAMMEAEERLQELINEQEKA